MWDENTYVLQNFNGATIEAWVWINNLITHFISLWLLIHAGIKVKPSW